MRAAPLLVGVLWTVLWLLAPARSAQSEEQAQPPRPAVGAAVAPRLGAIRRLGESIEGAVNVPLYLIRLKLSTLDRNTPYVAYWDTGRRSSAAAYILVERGFDAYVLIGMNSDGGLPLTRGGPAPKP